MLLTTSTDPSFLTCFTFLLYLGYHSLYSLSLCVVYQLELNIAFQVQMENTLP